MTVKEAIEILERLDPNLVIGTHTVGFTDRYFDPLFNFKIMEKRDVSSVYEPDEKVVVINIDY